LLILPVIVKTIMKMYEYFSDPPRFWDNFSVVNPKTNVRSRMEWTKLIKACTAYRVDIDRRDYECARSEFQGTAFKNVFIYRKGSTTLVLQKRQAIAKKYREIKHCPLPWDED